MKEKKDMYSSTFKRVARHERFEEKNSVKGSISPDIGRYQPKYEVIHKKTGGGTLDYEKCRTNDYQFEEKFNYLDSRLGSDHKWIPKEKGCNRNE